MAEEAVPETGEPAGEAEPGIGWRRRWGPTARVVLFALVGAAGALALAGRVPAHVGPFDTTMGARPSLHGNTVVHLAPLGTIELDTHDWPHPPRPPGRRDRPRRGRAHRRQPQVIDRLGDEVADDVRGALVRPGAPLRAGGDRGRRRGCARRPARLAFGAGGAATGAVLVVGAGRGCRGHVRRQRRRRAPLHGPALPGAGRGRRRRGHHRPLRRVPRTAQRPGGQRRHPLPGGRGPADLRPRRRHDPGVARERHPPQPPGLRPHGAADRAVRRRRHRRHRRHRRLGHRAREPAAGPDRRPGGALRLRSGQPRLAEHPAGGGGPAQRRGARR